MVKIKSISKNYQDNLCNKCSTSIRGKCCYFSSYIFDDNSFWKISLSNHPCKYLNIRTGRCKIYNKRYELNPNCLTIEDMISLGTLPKECLYVINDQEYQNRKDLVYYDIPENIPVEVRGKYEEISDLPHLEIAVYDTLRTHLCPKCKSGDLEENWDDKYSILFFKYKCNKCRYKWNNFSKQITWTYSQIKKINKIKKGSE